LSVVHSLMSAGVTKKTVSPTRASKTVSGEPRFTGTSVAPVRVGTHGVGRTRLPRSSRGTLVYISASGLTIARVTSFA
jgi:hypothetical protein